MKDRITIFLTKYPLFLYLLPVFFVLHGFTENYDFVPVMDALFLTGIYMGASVLLLLLFRLVYKNWMKAAIMAFGLMAFHFFFGSIQDILRRVFPGSLLSKYVFILPLSFCLLVAAMILLKRRKKTLQRFAFYLSSLFALLLIIDFIWLISKTLSSGKNEYNTLSKEFIPCNNCAKPDVYIIIADEYAGNGELKDIFQFDNSAFLNQLATRGFHVIPNSSSNYDYTPYSIASTLNMDYLDLNRTNKMPLLAYTYETISNNKLLQFLQYHQYSFYNYSLSDFRGHPTHAEETFLPAKTKLITSQTFLSRIEKELRFLLMYKFKSKQEIRNVVYASRDNNQKLIRLTAQTAGEKTSKAKFVLTHLMMPHYPYYYDKNGKEFPFEKVVEGNQDNQHNYIEYLQYANNRLLELLDHILQNSSAPPLIILMGDHGFRHFTGRVARKYYFNNLVAVYLPGKNYAAFTDSLTNVNLLRTVLNTSFGQQLPYLKDTTINMSNP